MENYKRQKLERSMGLRVMNNLGMVSWKPCEYDGARQYLRLLHPLAWVWFVSASIYGVFIQGVPNTYAELKHTFKKDTVLF